MKRRSCLSLARSSLNPTNPVSARALIPFTKRLKYPTSQPKAELLLFSPETSSLSVSTRRETNPKRAFGRSSLSFLPAFVSALTPSFYESNLESHAAQRERHEGGCMSERRSFSWEKTSRAPSLLLGGKKKQRNLKFETRLVLPFPLTVEEQDNFPRAGEIHGS